MIRIIANNAADTATASATTENASYPASNLLTVSHNEEARTTDATANREFKLTWSANQSVNMIMLCRLNLTTSGTIRGDLYSDAAWTTGLVNSGTVTPFVSSAFGTLAAFSDSDLRGLKVWVWYPSLQTTVRSLKITVNDTGNPDSCIKATRIFVGTYQEVDAVYGLSTEWVDGAEQYRDAGGNLNSLRLYPPYRRLSIPMELADASLRLIYSDLFRFAGQRRDMAIDLFPGDTTAKGTDGRGQFKLARLGGVYQRAAAHWSTVYDLEEV